MIEIDTEILVMTVYECVMAVWCLVCSNQLIVIRHVDTFRVDRVKNTFIQIEI